MDSHSLEILVNDEARKINEAIEKSSIPDMDPHHQTVEVFNDVGRRGHLLGNFFMRTRVSTDPLNEAEVATVSQRFGIETEAGEEYNLVAFDYCKEDCKPLFLDLGSVAIDKLDLDIFVEGDFDGYSSVEKILFDLKGGTSDTSIVTDKRRMLKLAEEAIGIAEENMSEHAEFVYILARDKSYCEVNSTYSENDVVRSIQSGEFAELERKVHILTDVAGTRILPTSTLGVDTLVNIATVRKNLEFCLAA